MRETKPFPVSFRMWPGLLFCIAVFAEPSRAVDNWQPGAGWNLVWSDEFSGSQLDARNWTFDLGGGGWGNKELERYTSAPTNVFVANGELVIQAVKTGTNYTSARIKTQGLRSWTYGKVAARMKLPYGAGIWPAFWLLGNGISTIGWPRCGEIDIMELIGGGTDGDGTVYGTAHWAENGTATSKGSGPHSLPKGQFFYQDYHVFELEWSATNLVWRLDGSKYFSAPINPTMQPGTVAFQKPFFIILNIAVGGSWPGPPNSSTVFPEQMHVDWVRVYRPGEAGAPPKLEIQKSGNEVILTWPSGPAYSLENAKGFQDPLVWDTVVEPAQAPISVVPNQPRAFFRLKQ